MDINRFWPLKISAGSAVVQFPREFSLGHSYPSQILTGAAQTRQAFLNALLIFLKKLFNYLVQTNYQLNY